MRRPPRAGYRRVLVHSTGLEAGKPFSLHSLGALRTLAILPNCLTIVPVAGILNGSDVVVAMARGTSVATLLSKALQAQSRGGVPA